MYTWPRVFTPHKSYRVKNLRWLVNRSGKDTIKEFRVYFTRYSKNWQLSIVVRFESGYIYATHYASYRVFRRWIQHSRNLKNVKVTMRVNDHTIICPANIL